MELPSVKHLKNKLSSRIIRIFFIFLTIAILPGFIFSIKSKLWPLAIFNTVALSATLIMFLYKKSPYTLKVLFLLGCTYLSGTFLLYYKGPFGTGILYYFALVCVSSLFLSLRLSIVINALSALTFLALGLSSHFLQLEWSSPYQTSFVFTAHYTMISLVITFSTHYMLGGLRKYIHQQKNLYFRLGKEKKRTQKALEENETLYKELHHRVKNNLYLITNLLELHHMQKESSEQDLRNIINRIQSISLVHDLISAGNKNEKYIAQDFVEEIIQRLFHSLKRENINLISTLSIKSNCLQTKKLSQLTLVLNEIFTNSIKYAFPKNESGIIHVSGEQIDEHVQFTISDNGVGFNIDEYNRNESLGLELIEILTKQMKGTCICNSCSSGTIYKITIPC